MAFDKHKAPTLPLPPAQYSAPYFTQLLRTIGSYFNIIDSKTPITTDNLTTNILNLKIGKYVASNGSNNNIVLPSTGVNKGSSFVRITGPTSGFTITGIETRISTQTNNYGSYEVQDGHVLILYNTTNNQMSLHNLSPSSAQQNQIICGGANINVSSQSSALLIYSVLDNSVGAWILIAHK